MPLSIRVDFRKVFESSPIASDPGRLQVQNKQLEFYDPLGAEWVLLRKSRDLQLIHEC